MIGTKTSDRSTSLGCGLPPHGAHVPSDRGNGLDLGRAPARVRPLRELFGDGSIWRSREKSAAQALARARKWDCVRTRIGLGPGEYTLTVKGGATYIDLPGEPRISPEIDPDRFFESLAGARLDPVTEATVRAALGG